MAYLIDLTVVHPSSASSPISRPNPLSLTPPNGTLALSIAHALTVTWPDSKAVVTRWARLMSLVKTAALRPCRESLALAMTSSSVVKGAMLYRLLVMKPQRRVIVRTATGPKISSFMIVAS